MLNNFELLKEYKSLQQLYIELSSIISIEKLIKSKEDIEQQLSSQNFWDNKNNQNTIVVELKKIEQLLDIFNNIDIVRENIEVQIELDLEEDYKKLLVEYSNYVQKLEELLLYNDKFDKNNCFLTVRSGVGGTEQCDWQSMLLSMYIKYQGKSNIKCDLIDVQDGDVAGIKIATLFLQGKNCYGKLRYEQGIHRLIRLSPFNANNLRQTSFQSVSLLPELDDSIDVHINSDDLKIDTYVGTGAGGQHRNKTESAIRITHIPTNIVVTCQTERSQTQNKQTQMNMLRQKLYTLEEQKQLNYTNEIQGELQPQQWSSQMRTYTFQPQKLIKDHRTNYEEYSTDNIMDGYLQNFILKEILFFKKPKGD